jgi:ATP-dependent Clp protease ATP-binding subunit ClpX
MKHWHRRKRDAGDEALRCSFCGKSQDEVTRLIANPPDRPIRAYVCNECIALCNSILDDYKKEISN